MYTYISMFSHWGILQQSNSSDLLTRRTIFHPACALRAENFSGWSEGGSFSPGYTGDMPCWQSRQGLYWGGSPNVINIFSFGLFRFWTPSWVEESFQSLAGHKYRSQFPDKVTILLDCPKGFNKVEFDYCWREIPDCWCWIFPLFCRNRLQASSLGYAWLFLFWYGSPFTL